MAPTSIISTVAIEATARPLKNSNPITNNPLRAMITVTAANSTARPAVRTDSRAAARGSRPASRACLYRLITNRE